MCVGEIRKKVPIESAKAGTHDAKSKENFNPPPPKSRTLNILQNKNAIKKITPCEIITAKQFKV